jgi:integrase
VRRRFLSLADAQKLIDNAQDQELKFALLCSLHAAFRYVEVTQSKPEWFNWKTRLIHIQGSDTWVPKNGKNRTVPMSKEFAGFLEKYMARLPVGAQFIIAPGKLSAVESKPAIKGRIKTSHFFD